MSTFETGVYATFYEKNNGKGRPMYNINLEHFDTTAYGQLPEDYSILRSQCIKSGYCMELLTSYSVKELSDQQLTQNEINYAYLRSGIDAPMRIPPKSLPFLCRHLPHTYSKTEEHLEYCREILKCNDMLPSYTHDMVGAIAAVYHKLFIHRKYPVYLVFLVFAERAPTQQEYLDIMRLCIPHRVHSRVKVHLDDQRTLASRFIAGFSADELDDYCRMMQKHSMLYFERRRANMPVRLVAQEQDEELKEGVLTAEQVNEPRRTTEEEAEDLINACGYFEPNGCTWVFIYELCQNLFSTSLQYGSFQEVVDYVMHQEAVKEESKSMHDDSDESHESEHSDEPFESSEDSKMQSFAAREEHALEKSRAPVVGNTRPRERNTREGEAAPGEYLDFDTHKKEMLDMFEGTGERRVLKALYKERDRGNLKRPVGEYEYHILEGFDPYMFPEAGERITVDHLEDFLKCNEEMLDKSSWDPKRFSEVNFEYKKKKI